MPCFTWAMSASGTVTSTRSWSVFTSVATRDSGRTYSPAVTARSTTIPENGARMSVSRSASAVSDRRASAAETDHFVVAHWVRILS